MKAAILFLFYKSPGVCRQNLALLRKLNPDTQIFGLYGGDQRTERFFDSVRENLDDYWAHPVQVPYWKYVNVDCVVADWYLNRGQTLAWDSLFFYEWDLLTLVPIQSLAVLERQSQFILYHREEPVSTLMQRKWYWVHREAQRASYTAFERELTKEFGASASFWGHEAVFYVLSRRFFEAASGWLARMPGMIEYRLPSLAATLGYELTSAQIPPQWAEFNRSNQVEVVAEEISAEMAKPDGCRCFHPVYADYYLQQQ